MYLMTVSKAVLVAVRGFHFYRNSWSHEASEIQECCECGNVFDIFAVKICLSNENTVGHLPRKVSRIIKYLIDRGDIVKSTLTTTDCRRFRGGVALEITCKVSVKMPAIVRTIIRYIFTVGDVSL